MNFTKPNRHIDRVFIHCSATPNKSITVKDIDRWHRDRGWSGVGYHYFIRTDGTLEKGRDLEKTPAAQSGHNTGTIAICCNGLKVSDFTEGQFRTLRDLCYQINEAIPGVTFHGHREVSAKSCPVFDYRRVLGLSSTGVMLLNNPSTPTDPPDDSDELARCLIPKSTVQAYQSFKGLVPDGILGEKTWSALTNG